MVGSGDEAYGMGQSRETEDDADYATDLDARPARRQIVTAVHHDSRDTRHEAARSTPAHQS